MATFEHSHEETTNLGFRPSPTQIGLYSLRKKLDVFRKKTNFTICVAKTKALISCAVTAQLIFPFVFAYVDCWSSCAAVHFHRDINICHRGDSLN